MEKEEEKKADFDASFAAWMRCKEESDRRQEERKIVLKRIEESEAALAKARTETIVDALVLKKNEVVQPALAQQQAPGIDLFHVELRYRLFTPDSIRLVDLVSETASEKICNQMIMQASHKVLLSTIQNAMVKHAFKDWETHRAICRFCFFQMAAPKTMMMILFCRNILEAQLASAVYVWVPEAADIMAVLLNYGTTLDELCFQGCDISLPQLFAPQTSSFVSPCDPKLQLRTDKDSLQCLMQFLGKAFLMSKKATTKTEAVWSSHHLDILALALLRINCSLRIYVDVSEALESLLQAYSNDGWNPQRLALMLLENQSEEHHHNLLDQLQVFMTSVRGAQMRQTLGLLLVKKLMDFPLHVEEETEEAVEHCKDEEAMDFDRDNEEESKGNGNLMKQLVSVLKKAPHHITDPYCYCTMIKAVDVISGPFPSPHSLKALKEFSDVLENLTSKLKIKSHEMDKVLLMNLILRLKAKCVRLCSHLE